MTHPIVEGLTEAVTMAKLMRENEELRRELADEKALADRLYSDIRELTFHEYDRSSTVAYREARGL